MIRRRRGAALIALTAATLALGLAGCGDDDDDAGDASGTSIGFSQIADSGVSGTVDLSQEGDRVTGLVEVSGMEPGTAHAVHIHGVAGEDHGCSEDERTSSHLIDLPDIVADDDGVGRLDVDVEGPADAIRSGTYIMVHENPTMHGGDSHGEAKDEADETATIGGVEIQLVHAGEEHGSPAEAQAHKNPPIACAEFTDN